MASRCEENPFLAMSAAELHAQLNVFADPYIPLCGDLKCGYERSKSRLNLEHWTSSLPCLHDISGRCRHDRDEYRAHNYHHPITKHYDDKMDKSRLEHFLFSGPDFSALDRQKERMRRKLREHVKESFDREFGSKSKKKKKSTKSRTSPLYSTENIPKPIRCDDKERVNTEDGETTKSTNSQNHDRSPSSKNTPHSNHSNTSTHRGSKGNGNGHGDKRRKRKQRRKKKRNKKRTANHAQNKKESHCNVQCKGSGSERAESTSTDSVSVAMSMSTSLSPACDSMLSQKELDELSLNEKTATMTNSTKMSVESESASDPVDPSGTDPFDGSVASGSMDRDIDDGDHEDSFLKSLDAEHALTADEMENKSKEEALCLTADDGESKEAVFVDHIDTVHRQNEEIQMLKQSVSTLIDTVSKLEELVLFHQSNAIPPRPEHRYEALDDFQNEVDSLSISEEIESLKQRVCDLESGRLSTCCGSEHEELRRWLTDEVALGQYFDILVDHGFEDLVAVQTLTMDILDAVEGIDKIGHKTRIMYFVQKLKDSAQDLDEIHEF